MNDQKLLDEKTPHQKVSDFNFFDVTSLL